MRLRRSRKLESAIDEITFKCPCGHSVEVFRDRRVCNHCGRLIFKNKEDEFKYRLREKLNRKGDRTI